MSFWQAKTKIDGADRLFSKFIRFMRDGNRCARCGVDGRVASLECSHFWGRRMESVRFDPENADGFCGACHREFEDQKGDGKPYWAWKLKQLGQQRFDALMIRANTPGKKGRKMAVLVVKALISEWNKNNGEVIMGAKA